jgi:hypothetical protein
MNEGLDIVAETLNYIHRSSQAESDEIFNDLLSGKRGVDDVNIDSIKVLLLYVTDVSVCTKLINSFARSNLKERLEFLCELCVSDLLSRIPNIIFSLLIELAYNGNKVARNAITSVLEYQSDIVNKISFIIQHEFVAELTNFTSALEQDTVKSEWSVYCLEVLERLFDFDIAPAVTYADYKNININLYKIDYNADLTCLISKILEFIFSCSLFENELLVRKVIDIVFVPIQIHNANYNIEKGLQHCEEIIVNAPTILTHYLNRQDQFKTNYDVLKTLLESIVNFRIYTLPVLRLNLPSGKLSQIEKTTSTIIDGFISNEGFCDFITLIYSEDIRCDIYFETSDNSKRHLGYNNNPERERVLLNKYMARTNDDMGSWVLFLKSIAHHTFDESLNGIFFTYYIYNYADRYRENSKKLFHVCINSLLGEKKSDFVLKLASNLLSAIMVEEKKLIYVEFLIRKYLCFPEAMRIILTALCKVRALNPEKRLAFSGSVIILSNDVVDLILSTYLSESEVLQTFFHYIIQSKQLLKEKKYSATILAYFFNNPDSMKSVLQMGRLDDEVLSVFISILTHDEAKDCLEAMQHACVDAWFLDRFISLMLIKHQDIVIQFLLRDEYNNYSLIIKNLSYRDKSEVVQQLSTGFEKHLVSQVELTLRSYCPEIKLFSNIYSVKNSSPYDAVMAVLSSQKNSKINKLSFVASYLDSTVNSFKLVDIYEYIFIQFSEENVTQVFLKTMDSMLSNQGINGLVSAYEEIITIINNYLSNKYIKDATKLIIQKHLTKEFKITKKRHSDEAKLTTAKLIMKYGEVKKSD